MYLLQQRMRMQARHSAQEPGSGRSLACLRNGSRASPMATTRATSGRMDSAAVAAGSHISTRRPHGSALQPQRRPQRPRRGRSPALRPRQRRMHQRRPCRCRPGRPPPPERRPPLRLGRQHYPAAARGGTRAAVHRARGWRQGLPACPGRRRPRRGRWRGRSRSARAAARPSWPRRGRRQTRPPSPAWLPGGRCRLR